MRLNKTFGFNLKLLSVQAANHRIARGKLKLHKPGFLADPRHPRCKYLLFIGDGYHLHPTAFRNKCLIICLILGYHRKVFIRDNSCIDEWNTICELNSYDTDKQAKAGKMLLEIYIKWCELLEINQKGPHTLTTTIQKFHTYFKMQVNVYSD